MDTTEIIAALIWLAGFFFLASDVWDYFEDMHKLNAIIAWCAIIFWPVTFMVLWLKHRVFKY